MFYGTSIYSITLQKFYRLQQEYTNICDIPKCWAQRSRTQTFAYYVYQLQIDVWA